MRDMIMLTNTQRSSDLPSTAFSPLTPEQEIAARAKLAQTLQMTLDPNEVLALFFTHIQSLISVSGLLFKFAGGNGEAKVGRTCMHHCDYNLTTDQGYLGEIIFSRSKRFTEHEMLTLEILLGSLIYPLRNAVAYQTVTRHALLDPLTLLGNRTALDNALRRELQLAERYQHELSLLMIDVDFFKKINDQHGHSRGDQVLREIAKVIQAVCRGTDITFRYGGEEFVVVLGKTDTNGAWVIAERIRLQIENTTIGHNGSAIKPTVSIGIATRLHEQKEHIDDLFDRADKALYNAKAAGKNRIMSGCNLQSVG